MSGRMYWLRSRKLFRVVVAFVAATLLPTLVAPMPRAGSEVVSDDYGDWLRSQLRAPADEAVDEALALAGETDYESLKEFLYAFAEAYEEVAPEGSLAEVLSMPSMSTDALLTHLEKRLVDRRGIPLFSPAALLSGKHFTVSSGSASMTGLVVGQNHFSAFQESLGVVVAMAPHVVTPLHVLFAARPRGP